MIKAKDQVELMPFFMRLLHKTNTLDRKYLYAFKSDIDIIIEAAFDELMEDLKNEQ